MQGPRSGSDDEAFLDDILDRFLSASLAAEAEVPCLDEALKSRPDLRRQVEDLLSLSRAVVDAPAPMPASVPGFRLERRLGRGGMASVWLARQESLGGRPVALKILLDPLIVGRRARSRFMVEARALARLRHRNVVPVHDVYDAQTFVGYAMEWLEGQPLSRALPMHRVLGDGVRDHLRRTLGLQANAKLQSKPWQFIADVGAQLARALEAVHRAGIVHRDVKPSNVVFHPDGTPVLIDFGVVRDFESELGTLEGEFVGTPAFAAPEQLKGAWKQVGPAADIYSLGATLYCLCTGELPNGSGSALEVLHRMESRSVPPDPRRNAGVPRDLAVIVQKAMEARPDRRYSTAARMAEDLERLLQGRPIHARPIHPFARVVRFVGRHRRIVNAGLLGGGLATLALAVLSIYLWVAPARTREYVRRARIELLEPYHVELARTRDHPAGHEILGPEFKARPILAVERYTSALSAYDRAIAWSMGGDSMLRSERETVALARALLSEEAVGAINDPLQPFVESWRRGGMDSQLPAGLLEQASESELRQVGLLAYLLGAPAACHEAWEGLAAAPGVDPLLDAGRGTVLMQQERGLPLALPRLLAALQEFPESTYLRACAADVYLRLGKPQLSRTLLSGTTEGARKDPYDLSLVVMADLEAWDGNFERAVQLHGQAIAAPLTAYRSHWHRGLLLAGTGQIQAAMTDFVALVQSRSCRGAERAHLIEAGHRWWEALDRQRQFEALDRVMIEGRGNPLSGLLEVAATFESNSENAAEFGTWEPPQVFLKRWKSVNADVGFSAPGVATGGLAAAALLWMTVQDELRWIRMLTSNDRYSFVATSLFLAELWKRLLASLPSSVRILVGCAGTRIARSWLHAFGALVVATSIAQRADAQQPLLDLPGHEAGEHFGFEVLRLPDLDSDGLPDLAVAGRDSLSGRGTLFLYSSTGTLIDRVNGIAPGDHFSQCMELLDDLDGGGLPDLAVAAPLEDAGALADSGRVRILSLEALVASGDLTGSVLATFDGSTAAAFCGTGLARIPDLDGDGYGELVVGLPGAGSNNQGQAVVLSSMDWSTVYFSQAGEDQWQALGQTVARLGDVDGDGTDDLAIGSPGATIAGDFAAGMARVWSGASLNTATPVTLHVLTGSHAYERVGWGLEDVGDIDGDDLDDFVVGAPETGTSTGLFAEVGKVRLHSAFDARVLWTGEGQVVGDSYGIRIASLGDLDADGWPEIAVSAPQKFNAGPGYVDVVRIPSGQPYLRIPGAPVDEEFGVQLRAADVDLDGQQDMMVGAFRSDIQSSESGRLTVYTAVGCRPVTKVYCVAKRDSFGGLSSIGTSGFPSLTGPVDDFHVTARGVLSATTGWLTWGLHVTPGYDPFAASGSPPIAFGSSPFASMRCVGRPFFQTARIPSGGSGHGSSDGAFAHHLSQSDLAAAGVGAGTTIYAQWWFVDGGLADGLGHTNAVAITVQN